MADRVKIQLQTSGMRNFETLARSFTPAKRRQALRPGARIILLEIRKNAPVGTREHAYYTGTTKGSKKPNGQGQKLRTFKPGNAKRSFSILNFRRSADLFVGPRTGKKSPYDGYYVPWLEFGTSKMSARPFIRPAVEAKRAEAERAIMNRALQIVNGEVRKLARRAR
jgi:HK97 gp10 family phage protein